MPGEAYRQWLRRKADIEEATRHVMTGRSVASVGQLDVGHVLRSEHVEWVETVDAVTGVFDGGQCVTHPYGELTILGFAADQQLALLGYAIANHHLADGTSCDDGAVLVVEVSKLVDGNRWSLVPPA